MRSVVGQVFGPEALGDAQVEAMLEGFPSTLVLKGFDTQTRAVTAQWVDAYVVLVGRLAALAGEKPAIRQALEAFAGKPCNGTPDLESACGADLARRLVGALWRLPPMHAEVDASLRPALDAYRANKDRYDAARAYGGFVASVLLSARSALRMDAAELGKTGAVDAFALGARLAMTLASALPDGPLRAKMEDGSIARPEVLRAEARRLLRTPAGRATLRHFAEQWLNVALVKAPPAATGYVATKEESERVADAARAEVGRLFEEVAVERGGRLEDLFSLADVVPTHDWLAKVYGTAKGDRIVPAGVADRRGLLSRVAFNLHGAFGDYLPLAHRGYGVAVTVLCGTVGALPDDIDTTLPAGTPDVLSSRQFFEALTERGSCAVCHAKFNQYGYAMSGFAVTGARLARERVKNRRTMQMAEVEVTEATRLTLDGVERAVSGAGDLSEALGRSRQARACFAHRLDQFAVGAEEPFLCADDGGAARAPADARTLEETILDYVGSPAFAAR